MYFKNHQNTFKKETRAAVSKAILIIQMHFYIPGVLSKEEEFDTRSSAICLF